MFRLIAKLVFVALFVSSASAADLGTEAQKKEGAELYEKHCTQCHGDKGDGKGPAAYYYKPAPRDFTKGKYKVRTTASGELPTDQDIKRAIEIGLAFKQGGAYTVMPPWPKLSDDQLMSLVYYLKTFAADFSNPEYNNPKQVELPEPPPYSEESVAKGRKVFEDNECIRCHGEYGRSDGRSAPTLTDDWDFHIRPADLTKRWTFRGGGERKDIFRTISTGFNGTPMPSYADSVSIEDRWHLVNYVYSLSTRDDANYNKANQPISAAFSKEVINISSYEEAVKNFEGATPAYIPIVGQVIEPGRSLYPGVNEVEVRSVYDTDSIAVMLRWNDMRKDVSGSNSPDAEAPRYDPAAYAPEGETEDEDEDPFGDEEEEEEDPFGDDDEDPFAEDDGEEEGTKFSDAIAVQFPVALSGSFKKPYFLFGDKKQAVDLWFVDLAKNKGEVYLGKGMGSVKPASSKKVDVVSNFDKGQWTVVFKRARTQDGAVSFEEQSFVPIALSVWDGFDEERGAKRGITSWYQLYLEASEEKSAVGPMLSYGLGILLLEVLFIGYIRKKYPL